MGTSRSPGPLALVAVVAIVFLLAGCAAPSPPPLPASNHTLVLTSDAFPVNGTIPVRYTCDGQGVSPPFSWNNVPAGTRSYVLIMEDPDAPAGTFTHWILYNIPGEKRDLPTGIAPGKELPGGGQQGINSGRETGYAGPCPPRGSTHHYIVTLYALDIPLDPAGTMDAGMLRNVMEGHILGTGQLIGTYLRS